MKRQFGIRGGRISERGKKPCQPGWEVGLFSLAKPEFYSHLECEWLSALLNECQLRGFEIQVVSPFFQAQYVKADTHYYLRMVPYCLFQIKVFVQLMKNKRLNAQKAAEYRRFVTFMDNAFFFFKIHVYELNVMSTYTSP
jgi:hypothetical protein